MTRSFRLLLAALFAALALAGTAVQGQSGPATITFNDPNCGSWGMTQSGSNFTLTCQSLACSISSDFPAPTPSQTPTLTAKCTGASANAVYAWTNVTGGTCPNGTPGGTPTGVTYGTLSSGGTAMGPCVYKVAVTDGSNGAGSAQTSVTWSTAPPPPPTGCVATVTPNPSPMVNAGGTAALNVTGCSPSTGLTYNWTKNVTVGAANTASWTDVLPAGGTAGYTNTYQVKVCNGPDAGTNCANFPSSLLSVAVPGTGTGGGLDMSSCTAQGLTGRLYDLPYSTTGNVNTDSGSAVPGGVFGNTDVLIVRFTTPSVDVNGGSLQLNPTAGYPQTFKIATLSGGPFACTIAQTASVGGAVLATQRGIFPNITWRVSPNTAFGQPTLLPNTTYYITYVLRDAYGAPASAGNCPTSDCKQDIHFQN